jgi:hypothetical protein
MKIIAIAAFAVAISSSTSRADQLAASARAEGTRFAAMSLTKEQGVRALISNVLAPTNNAHPVACEVLVSFFDADGSVIGKVVTVQLKPGESTSVPASYPSKLVRAVISVGDIVDPDKACALRTSLEIFDVQTDTTFVSVPGETISRRGECGASDTLAIGTARNHVAGRRNSPPGTTSSSLSGGAVSPTKPPVLAATPAAAPR